MKYFNRKKLVVVLTVFILATACSNREPQDDDPGMNSNVVDPTGVNGRLRELGILIVMEWKTCCGTTLQQAEILFGCATVIRGSPGLHCLPQHLAGVRLEYSIWMTTTWLTSFGAMMLMAPTGYGLWMAYKEERAYLSPRSRTRVGFRSRSAT